jgi:hypothetical protein
MDPSSKKILDLYFAQHDHRQIIYPTLIESMNRCMDVDVPDIIERSCPLIVNGSPDLTLAGTTRAAAGTAGTGMRISVDDTTETPSGTAPATAVMGGRYPHGGPPREVELNIKFKNVKIRRPANYEPNGVLVPM